MEPATPFSPDPLGYHEALPLRQRFYPLGCAVDLSTNSSAVLETAHARWSEHDPVFDDHPVAFSVVVAPEGAVAQPPVPTFRVRDHLVMLAADSAHFGCGDLTASTVACWVAEDTVRKPAYLGYHYLDPLILLLLSERYFTPIHAGCVARNGRGVLLAGSASAGKSCLSYACARAGWTLVSDDAGYMVRDDPDQRVFGRPRFLRFEFSAERLFPELRGLLATEAAKGEDVANIDSTVLPGIETATECRAEVVVFLERQAGMTSTLTAVDEEDALKRLLAELPIAAETTRTAQVASLRKLLKKGAYRLNYDRPEDAVGKLERLVRN